ncbi:N-acetyltransferase [Halobacillus litoralis]|uniref:GNAT family N-acetyltransferase n=1 Tax=Halobacillus litoralis TaxID=45668 RepID=UPI001CD70081|nr:GNAT family N-acetyltransferase [Halobacillus litoralis]MCA0972591.1 N-acetyltransferase [Halobacillus litoralis]
MSEIHEKEGLFYVGDVEDPVAHLSFEVRDGDMVITSTVVDPDQREQGLGTELIDYAVNYARKHKLLIDPACPFAGEVIGNTPEYQIVLK